MSRVIISKCKIITKIRTYASYYIILYFYDTQWFKIIIYFSWDITIYYISHSKVNKIILMQWQEGTFWVHSVNVLLVNTFIIINSC